MADETLHYAVAQRLTVAGLGAVFILHAHSWMLEREEIRRGNGRLIQLTKFSELKEHL